MAEQWGMPQLISALFSKSLDIHRDRVPFLWSALLHVFYWLFEFRFCDWYINFIFLLYFLLLYSAITLTQPFKINNCCKQFAFHCTYKICKNSCQSFIDSLLVLNLLYLINIGKRASKWPAAVAGEYQTLPLAKTKYPRRKKKKKKKTKTPQHFFSRNL